MNHVFFFATKATGGGGIPQNNCIFRAKPKKTIFANGQFSGHLIFFLKIFFGEKNFVIPKNKNFIFLKKSIFLFFEKKCFVGKLFFRKNKKKKFNSPPPPPVKFDNFCFIQFKNLVYELPLEGIPCRSAESLAETKKKRVLKRTVC